MPTLLEEIATLIKPEILRILRDRFGDLRVRNVLIDGIEVTQTIQYYKADQHLTDPALRVARDNAVVLAAFKPAWVRTYVRSAGTSPFPGVKAVLTVERRRRGFLWDTVATLTPQPPGSITAKPVIDYATERSSTFNSLNFIIPAADCYGVLRLTVQLTDSRGVELDSSSVVVHATLVQTLRLRGILIGYNGPSTATVLPNAPPPSNIVLSAPTLADLQSTASRALLAMPVQSTGSFALAGQITLTLPLDDPRTGAGGCSTNWTTLLNLLATQRTNDGNRSDVVYYGLLPALMPLNVPGCGNAGLGAGAAGDLATLLHEIGHGYGFTHTPCGAAGTTDANYPNYKPYPSASIGEYGFDISNGTVFPPAITLDYMSYCFPQWMSLYQHERLVGHPRLNPSWLSDNPIWDQYGKSKRFSIPEDVPDPPFYDPWKVARMRRDPVISIIGVVHSATEVEVTSVARVRAESTPPGHAVALSARLIDGEGRELARAALYELVAQGGFGCCGDDRGHGVPPYAFQAMIPDVAVGAAITIGGDESVLWERRAPSSTPTISQVTAEVGEIKMHLAWKADVSGHDYEAWIQWSSDEGKTWNGLTTALKLSYVDVDLAGLPPAGEIRLRVLLHDGFHSVTSEPIMVELPHRSPAVSILTPEAGQILFAGSPMRLWAAATDSSGALLPDQACHWELDGREAGRGIDLWIPAPTPGEHRATLIVRPDGKEGRATAHFTTIGGFREEC